LRGFIYIYIFECVIMDYGVFFVSETKSNNVRY
jgi:hypothetical protein